MTTRGADASSTRGSSSPVSTNARTVEKWGLWVLSELSNDGPLRFSRLLERVERISQKSLTATLRQLERDGLVTRTMVAQVPIRVDYAITPLGRSLIDQVQPLWLWAIERLPDFIVARAAYDARAASRSGDGHCGVARVRPVDAALPPLQNEVAISDARPSRP